MALSLKYNTIHIPEETAHLNELASKFRSLKLHALQTSPKSFAAAFADEVALAQSAWTRR